SYGDWSSDVCSSDLPTGISCVLDQVSASSARVLLERTRVPELRPAPPSEAGPSLASLALPAGRKQCAKRNPRTVRPSARTTRAKIGRASCRERGEDT